MNTLTVARQTDNNDFYMAEYNGEEALNLAYKSTLCDAITEALLVWGLSESDVFIEASN